MSVLVYGGPPGVIDPTQGIALSYINTRAISDEPQYSDDGTEYLYTKRTVQCTCIFNANLAPALIGETPAITMTRVRHTLQLPRRQLLFFHNNILDPVPLIVSPQAGLDRDAKHGPFCRHVNITQIQGSECFLVDVEYETYINECSAGGFAPFYISHRWLEDSTIDERFFTTRTRVGKIVVQADQKINPSSLRGIVSPPIPVGFLRQRSQYILQEDGLAMQYTFVDREVYLSPPSPAVKAEGEYFESTADGATRWGECRVKLYGAKVDPTNANVSGGKGALLQLAIAIVVTKLQTAGVLRSTAKASQGAWIAIGGIREDLYDNVVEVRFKAQLRPGLGTVQKAALDLVRFVDPPFGSDFLHPVAPDPGTGGTAQLGLDVGIANLINDPCLGNLQIVAPDTVEASAPVGSDEIPYPIIGITPQIPDDLSIFDDSDDSGVYTDYQIHKQYRHNDYQIHLPTTQSSLTTSPASPLPAGGTVLPVEGLSAVVTVAAGTLQIIVEWIAERTGAQPKIPQFYPNDPNVVLLNAIYDPGMMSVAGDGVSKKWRSRGCYTYAVLDRTKITISAGVPPYITPTIAPDAAVDPFRIVTGIIDSPGVTNVMLQTQTPGTSP